MAEGNAARRFNEERENADKFRKERDKKEQQRNDIAWLLQQPQFMRYMSGWLNKHGMFNSVMTGNSQTFYNSGKQDLSRETWTALALVDKGKAHELLMPNFGEESDG